MAGTVLAGTVLAGTVLAGAVVTGAVYRVGVLPTARDTTGQQAVLALRVQVSEQDGDRLANDPTPVGGDAIAQQRKPGAFQVK
jgi:hypothetical protein